MKIVVVELKSELEQTVKAVMNAQVEAIRLHLYKHNNPAGSLQVLVKEKIGGAVVGTSELVDISVIPGDFFHGQVLFPLSVQLEKNKLYKIVLQHIGYSFSESDYVGWCVDFDFKTYPKGYDDHDSNVRSAFDYEFWVKKDLI